jgi:ATP-dependent phosphofructokinase / diphosphate-dependent phosphofructokinase
MTKTMRIGVLTSGGDCAGLNPALKWVVKTAMDDRLQVERGIRYEVIGIRDGFSGLADMGQSGTDVDRQIVSLDEDMVRTWDRIGGTMLGTSRYSPYDPRDERSGIVMKNIDKLGLEVLIVIGGDGSLSIASRLSEAGVNVIGIPKTIDKDLYGTEYTLGFDTALNVITEEVDRLRTTAGSHKRIFVIETMGRTAGWLALEGGESCGAYITLIPEYDFSLDEVNELVMEGKRKGARYEIILAAEGAKPRGGVEIVKKNGEDSFGHKALGGIAEFVADEINTATHLETRSLVLSHLQRGGAPSAHDRRMGRYFGIAAMDLVENKDYGKLVCYRNGEITTSPLKDILGKLHLVDVKTQYDAQRYSGRRTILGKSG